MAVTMLAAPFSAFYNSNGSPLSGGKIYTYSAGTTTPKDTYTDSTGSTPNSNPVVLDSAGRAVIWLNGAYKIVVKDSSDVVVWTTDNVTSGTTAGDMTAAIYDPATVNEQLVGLTATQTISNKTITNSAATLTSLNSGQLAGFRNPVLNGCFRVWQRGTSVSASSTSLTYTADRWAFLQSAGTVAATIAQQTNPATGVYSSVRVQRNNGNTNINTIAFGHTIESRDAVRLQGQQVTLSFYAKAGATFSASGITAQLCTGTTADEGTSAMFNSTWAGFAATLNSSISLTTTRTRYTVSGTIPSGALEIGVKFLFVPVGTAGASDYFEIDSVQVETGSVASPFEYRSMEVETSLCRRFYEAGTTGYHGDVSNTGNYGPYVHFSTQKRSAPTIAWGTVTVDTGSFDTTAPTVGLRFSTTVNDFQATKACTASSGDRGWSAPWTASSDL